jgi:hypothetical protein
MIGRHSKGPGVSRRMTTGRNRPGPSRSASDRDRAAGPATSSARRPARSSGGQRRSSAAAAPEVAEFVAARRGAATPRRPPPKSGLAAIRTPSGGRGWCAPHPGKRPEEDPSCRAGRSRESTVRASSPSSPGNSCPLARRSPDPRPPCGSHLRCRPRCNTRPFARVAPAKESGSALRDSNNI